MDRDEIIAKTFREIDASLRKASIAEIGGVWPSETLVTSAFGGRFVGAPGETWPMGNGGPMLPLLQVRVDELPEIPEALKGIALFNVFIGPSELPIDLPAANGVGWCIRTHASLENLTPLPGEPKTKLRPFPIRWSLSETEAPGWEDAWDVTDLSDFNDLPDGIDLFYDRYTSHPLTKIGGWPHYIQGSSARESDTFVFQIGSEEKPLWMWGDNGTGYFSLRKGKWIMSWDCY